MNYVKELQSKLGLTVLMVTHNMKQVGGEYSDRVVVMNRGGVIDMVDSAENVFSASLGRREWGGSRRLKYSWSASCLGRSRSHQ